MFIALLMAWIAYAFFIDIKTYMDKHKQVKNILQFIMFGGLVVILYVLYSKSLLQCQSFPLVLGEITLHHVLYNCKLLNRTYFIVPNPLLNII